MRKLCQDQQTELLKWRKTKASIDNHWKSKGYLFLIVKYILVKYLGFLIGAIAIVTGGYIASSGAQISGGVMGTSVIIGLVSVICYWE